MGAIAGIIGTSRVETGKIIQTMKKRGPVQKGGYFAEQCCLLKTAGHIDTGESQPAEFRTKEKRYVLTWDGAIYNARKVKAELLKLGHHFKDSSTSEMILHAYVQWQEQCLLKLNGDFSIAIWEAHSQKLFLARDRMGVKPLFYRLENSRFIFASEIKTILACPEVTAELDETGAAQILLLGPGRIPGSGILKNIHELKPGYYGIYEHGKWICSQYWKLQDREHRESFDDTADHVRYLVQQAIKDRLDERAGTFLSGGLDSSIISAVSAGIFAAHNRKLPAFSLDFQNNDRYFTAEKMQPSSDTEYAQTMHRYLNTDRHWTIISADEQTEALEAAVKARDLPGMADIDSSMLLFCRDIRSHVPMMLSGECADEIFGGYPWYHNRQEKEGFPWSQNMDYRASFLHPDLCCKIDPNEYVMGPYLETVRNSDILPGTDSENVYIKQMVNLNIEWFMQTLLDRTDRMSMYSGLEVRVPFCDYEIAEYLYGVPWKFKENNGREKGLLRYAFRDILPDEILNRKKSPYPKSYDPRYLELVTKMLKALIADPDAPVFQIVNIRAVENLIESDQNIPWYGQLMKKPQIMAYLLQINSWMQSYSVNVTV